MDHRQKGPAESEKVLESHMQNGLRRVSHPRRQRVVDREASTGLTSAVVGWHDGNSFGEEVVRLLGMKFLEE
uniref:Uncharacterized protein n=1 Tax=Peronospora matthiolae TaxID=2874970 RepID=A0AAV1U2L5_9STRA